MGWNPFKAIGKAISGVVKAVGSIVGGVIKAVGSVVSAVVNFVASPFMGMFGVPDAPSNDAESARVTGVLIQKTGTNVSIPVVYGYRQVAGAVVFAETGSNNNKYLWVAYVLSEGPCEGLREVWINDIQISSENIPTLNSQTAKILTGKDNKGNDSQLNGITTLLFYKGGYQSNTGSVVKNGIFSGSPSFKDTMKFNGLCTIFARYEWKESTDTWTNPFGGGIPEMKVCLLGKQVARLTTRAADRSPVDARVTGADRPELYNWGDYPGGYEEGYSTNPVEILLDYLRNPQYGKGLTNNDIDWESFYIAAVKCNQSINYTTTATGPILTLNYVLDTNQTIFNNVKLLLQNFRGYLPYNRGKYVIKIEDAGNATDILSGSADIVAAFDKDNLHGEITYTGIERSSKYNQVVVKYVDPDNFWSEQTVVFPESQDDRWAYQTIDGGRENKGEFTFAGITNYMIAKDMARLLFNKSREQDSLSFTVSSSGFELEPGDNIYINGNILKFGDDPAQDAIPWRIVSIKLNNDYTFSVGAVRNPDWIYPHVRAGEIDYRYAVYVPRGASRYYPQEPVGTPVGINPPWWAPTDPNDPGNPPGNPGTPGPDDTVNPYLVRAQIRNGAVYATLAFNQPENPAYASTYYRYKTNTASSTSWTEMSITSRPGANQSIQFEIGPLANNTGYMTESRVRYINGDQSTRTATSVLNISVTVPGPTPPVVPPVIPPGVTPPPNNIANDSLAYAFGSPELSGGLPLTIRKVNFVVRQDVRAGTNAFLNGLEIFSKSSLESFWTRTTQSLTVTQGANINFSVLCGPRAYPSVPGQGGVAANIDNYDFIFRFTYSDGKTSIYQYRAMNCSTEFGAYGSYDFYVLAPDASGATVYAKELCTAYVPIVGTSGTLTDYRTITDNLTPYQLFASLNRTDLNWWFSQPLDSSGTVLSAAIPFFAGYKIYRRQIIAGTTITETPIVEYDNNTPYKINTGVYVNGVPKIGYGAILTDQTWDTEYQYVIVPQVWYNNVKTNATKCFTWKGRVHNRENETTGTNPYPQIPNQGNWFSRIQPTRVTTTEALNNLAAPYPDTNPVVRFQSVGKTGTFPSSGYFTLQFQVPSTYVSFKVYRRGVYDNKRTATGVYFNSQSLAGAGWWEQVTPTSGQFAIDANRVVTLNLRPGILGKNEFNFYDFNPQNAQSATNALYRNYSWNPVVAPTDKFLVSDNDTNEMTQVLIVLNYTSGGSTVTSTKAVLVDLRHASVTNILTDIQTVDFTTSTSSTSSLISPVPVPAPNAGNLNTINRSISEARSLVAANVIKVGPSRASYTLPTATPGVL